MASFDEMVGVFVIGTLLFLGIFSFIIVVQNNNGAADPLINNAMFNGSFSTLTTQINKTTIESQDKYDAFIEEDPKTGFGSIVLFGIVSVGKTFSGLVFSLFGAIIKLPLTVLGIAPNIYNLILAWLIIGIIVAVWLLYKLGG